MRTVIETRQRHAERRQLTTQRTFDFAQRSFREQAARHAGLIRDHDQGVPTFMQGGQALQRTGSQSHPLRIDVVGDIFNQRPIFVEENSSSPSIF